MREKIIVTHVNPHTDEVYAIWLVKKFYPGLKKSKVKFISFDQNGGKTLDGEPVDSNPNIIYVGICRGRFDEHKEGVKSNCSATLVWQFLDEKGWLPKDIAAKKALEEMTKYVLLGDTGQLAKLRRPEYQVRSIIAGYIKSQGSDKGLQFGLKVFDALFYQLKEKYEIREDWKKRIEFNTRWGQGVALESKSPMSSLYPFVFRRGYKILVFIVSTFGWRGFMAESKSGADFSEFYRKLKKIEPEADWFLHPQKTILICGDVCRPNPRQSQLSLQQLIDLIRI